MLIGIQQNKCVFVHQDIQLLDINVFVMEYNFLNFVIDVHIDQILNFIMECVDVIMDILLLVQIVYLTLIMVKIKLVIVEYLQYLIYNKKDAYLVLMVVYIVKIVIHVIHVHLTLILILFLLFVLKYVEMENVFIDNVMMVTLYLVMVVHQIVKYKLDILVWVDHLTLQIIA